MLIDSGFHCLALVAQFHRVAADAAALQHRFGQGREACSSDTLLRAARQLGLRARRVHPREIAALRRVLPAIATDREGRHFVLAAIRESSGEGVCYLVQRPGRGGPERLDRQAFSALWSGELILLAPRGGVRPGAQDRFNLRWFIPCLLKYRRLYAQVIIASFCLQLFALATPLFFQVVMDKVLVHQGFTTLDVLAFGFLVVVAFDAVVGGLRNYLFSHTSNRVDVELGARLFDHLARLPLAYFEARQVGQTVARVRELETVRNFITGTALTLLIDLGFTFVFLAVLWYYSPTLTWIVLASLPCYIALSLLVTPVLRQRLEEKFRHGAANQAFLTETVTGVETVKSQALEPQMQQRWESQLADYVSASFRAQNIGNIASQAAGFFSKVTTLLIVWWGAHLVIAGTLSVGQLVAFNMIAGRITAPILKLVQLWQDFQQAGISLQRLGDILNIPTESDIPASASNPRRLQGAVSFRQVRFRYTPGGPAVLDGLDLEVTAGEVIGLVGASGSGKSTLAKLLQRLYLPESGRLAVDGRDLATVDTAWLRRNIGVVQQESFLFNRSVRDNIAVANPGLPLEPVMQCAQVAGAHDFILELPQGYDTLIGEQGSNLSGGQRQRIAIARALMGEPRILILDEATSALDYESERVVQQNMGAIARGRTVFIIAHRLSAVRHCDRIAVLDGGGIAESGDHGSLLAAGGYYARLHACQSYSPPVRPVGPAAGHAGGAGA